MENKKDSVHIVEAYFSDWDSSHFEILGIFKDINQALRCQKKWSEFYSLGKKRYEELYQEVLDRDADNDYFDFQSCQDFISTQIKTYNIGEDIAHNRIMDEENQLKKLYIKFNRGETIKKITENE